MPGNPDYSTFAFSLDGYRINDDDEKSTDPEIQYYGYSDRFGAWYIQEHNTTLRSYRYAKGDSGYATNYAARESLTYTRWDQAFN